MDTLPVKGTGEYSLGKKASQDRQRARESNLYCLKEMDKSRSQMRDVLKTELLT